MLIRNGLSACWAEKQSIKVIWEAAFSTLIQGCPDTDGDGIADIDDKCPLVAGIKDNKGCPAVKEEAIKVFTQALTGILFETGKDNELIPYGGYIHISG